jgi:hypothetical protein
MEIIYKKIEDIKPYDKNAKLHNIDWIVNSFLIGTENIQDEAERLEYILKKSIDQPAVVDGEGILIKGHGRIEGAKRIGLKKFPVIVRTDLSPEQVRLARIADNRSGEAGWDYDLLQQDVSGLIEGLPGINLEDFGITEEFWNQAGINSDEPDSNSDKEPPGDFKEYDENIDCQYQCPKCSYKWSGKAK